MSAERGAVAIAGDLEAAPASAETCSSRREAASARLIRARGLVAGAQHAQIAAAIAGQCGSSKIRAYRLALGIALADVVAQVRARFEADGRRVPRFSETLLSAYESGQKRPGPEYLHYLCATYQADPPDLGYEGCCLCGGSHRAQRVRAPVAPLAGVPAQPAPGIASPHSTEFAAGSAAAHSTESAAGSASAPGMASADGVAPSPGVASPSGVAALPGVASPQGTASADGVAPAPGVVSADSSAAAHAGDGPHAFFHGHRDDKSASRSGEEDDDDELRRMLIRQMTAAGCRVDCRFLGAVDRIRRRLDDALLGGTVSAAMIDTWEQAVAGYGRQYMTVPAVRLLCDVLLDLADVRRMCEERQPLEFSERLCRLASQLAGLAGIAMLDLGDHRLARSFFRTARTAADETGDRQLRAWVAAREALVPLYYGDAGEAYGLGGSAADLAGRHLCVAAVMAPVIEARAQARLGSASCQGRREALNRARAALDKAADAIADLPAEQRADTALGYTERQLYFHSGDALVGLGDWQGASRAFGLAAQLYPPGEVLDCALVTLGQARCLLESDEPRQALALGRDIVLGLPPEHRTDVILQVARQLGQAACERHPCLPGLSEFREALATA